MERGFSRLKRRRAKTQFMILLVIASAFAAVPLKDAANASEALSSLPRISGKSLPSALVASTVAYDEQVGITLTQNFSTLAFNVTAVAFTDNGIGPGYLVNGLTDLGYWYQVGLSYNWPMTNGAVNPGFSMNYEVFSPTLVSIDPPHGGGGIQSFNGTVNAGDSVMLSLTFSLGEVVMQAIDWQTGSVASQTFNSYASVKVFIGLTSSLDQSGFFSGLMTEQYHYNPYYGAGQPVVYSVTSLSISRAWLWMDEFNTNTLERLFVANTTSPVSLDGYFGQYFSSNGTAEIATSHKLVTGLAPVTFPSLVPSSQSIGQPGHPASIIIAIDDQDGATVRFGNLTISTKFGKYNFTFQAPFSFGSSLGLYKVGLMVPASLPLGTYNMTIKMDSWNYLDAGAQVWVLLRPSAVNETLLVTNTPPPPPNPSNSQGPNPPNSGQGPSETAIFHSSLLAILRSLAVPALAGYVALTLLASALLIKQGSRKLGPGLALGPRFCTSCGRELDLGASICSNCPR